MNKIKNFFAKIHSFLSKVSKTINKYFFLFLEKYDFQFCLVVLTVLAIVLRVLVFDKQTGDYTTFLREWYRNLYTEGAKALGKINGDYSPAYYYFLYSITLFKINPDSIKLLHFIKAYSCIFDAILSVYVFLTIRLLTKNKTKMLLSYALIQFGLTIFLNSALWGQCDAIFASFCVMSFYYLLKDKPRASMICYGFAFCFKLQSIFILPFFLVVSLRKGLKFRYYLYVPLIYMIVGLPSCFLADNFFNRFGEVMMVYINQAGYSYTQLSLNAGSFYTLIFTNFKNEDYISNFSIPLAGAIIGVYMYLIYRSKETFNKTTLVKIITLFAMAVPYFLPHMHDRYFYLADVFVIIYVLCNPKRFYVAFLAITNSMIGYMVYLWNIPFFNVVPQEQSDPTKALSFRFGAILYLIAIIIITIDLFKEIYPNGFNNDMIKEKEVKEETKQNEEIKAVSENTIKEEKQSA